MEATVSSNKYRTLLSDIMIFIIGTVLAKAIQLILMPLYTTYMSTEAYGIAELTNNLSELFFPIATLCVYEAAFRFAVDPEFSNRKLATAVAKVMLISSGIGLFIAIFVKIFLGYQYAFYLFFILYAYSIRMCAAYYIRGNGKSKIFAMSGVVNAISLSIFNVIFLVILKTGENGYLLSIGLSYCVSAIYLIVAGKIARDIVPGESIDKEVKVLLPYCIPLIFYNVLYWFTTISGRYILLGFTDASTAGKYVAAIKISAVVNMIQQAVYAAFQLNSSRIFTEKGKEKYYTEITNLFICLYCIFGSIIVCITPLLAKFTLMNEFYEAKVFLPIIMLAAILNCVSSLLGTMYSTYKKTQKMIGVSLVGSATNIIVGLVLTPILGIWGVCIASVFCYLSQVIYKFVDVRKFCKIKYNWIKIVPNLLLLTLQVILMSTDKTPLFGLAILVALVLFVINSRDVVKAVKKVVRR